MDGGMVSSLLEAPGGEAVSAPRDDRQAEAERYLARLRARVHRDELWRPPEPTRQLAFELGDPRPTAALTADRGRNKRPETQPHPRQATGGAGGLSNDGPIDVPRRSRDR